METKYCKYKLSNKKLCYAEITGSDLSTCMPHFLMIHTKPSKLHETCCFPVEYCDKWRHCNAPRVEGDIYCSEHTEKMIGGCKAVLYGDVKCKLDTESSDSRYCAYHHFTEVHDGKGCILASYDKHGQLERCCIKTWHPQSRYCRNHYSKGVEEGLGKPRGCPVVVDGEKCERPCPEGGLCLIHNPNVIKKCKELIGQKKFNIDN